jgi:hypothetical protein
MNCDMDEKLKDIFSNTNDWLKFAEAKSATLIAGNGVLIFGMIRLISLFKLEGVILFYAIFIVALCILSITICFLSVIPSLSMPWESKPHGTNDTDNLLYFYDIAKYSPLAYLKALEKRLGTQNSDFTGYQKELARQIITNSVITRRKYGAFQTAVWLTLAAIISPILAIIVYQMRAKQ